MSETKVLVKFFWDCGRSGEVQGLFITTASELQAAYGKDVYFGEILGKHSEVYGTLGEDDVEIISEDQNLLETLENLLGATISGYNPLEYLQESDELDD